MTTLNPGRAHVLEGDKIKRPRGVTFSFAHNMSSHEGTAETHKSYQNDDFLVFRNDHFSTYEIAYKQVPKDQVQPSQSSSSSSSSSTKATGGTAKSGSSSAKSTTPKTGDNGLLVGAVCSLLLASACVLAIARRRVR